MSVEQLLLDAFDQLARFYLKPCHLQNTHLSLAN
jgi:hypothetical protein